MKNRDFVRIAVSASVAIAVLGGCGGQQAAMGAPTLLRFGPIGAGVVNQPSAVPEYKASDRLLYVTNFDQKLTPLAIYKAKKGRKPIATISEDIDNSRGACIDGAGTLYVTNDPLSSSGWVSEYAFGQTTPSRVITEGINSPGYCAIDASGNLWVTNIALDNVTEYPKGSTKPQATITDGLTLPIGIAIDRTGNLYVGNLSYSGSSNIQVYAPGKVEPSRTITSGVSVPDGIAVDADNTLYVTTHTAHGSIEEYRAGRSQPFVTITDKLSYPADVVVGANGWLYVANEGQYSDEMEILEFAPHAVKPSRREITNGLFHPVGVAYYPPLLP
jgi:hypothetical protein